MVEDENDDQREEETKAAEEEAERVLGWRELPRVVNLKDFAQMVGGEAVQIGSSLRLALVSLTHLPFGPLFGSIGLALVALRSCLLFFAVFVFGTGILLITVLRGLSKLTGRRPPEEPGEG